MDTDLATSERSRHESVAVAESALLVLAVETTILQGSPSRLVSSLETFLLDVEPAALILLIGAGMARRTRSRGRDAGQEGGMKRLNAKELQEERGWILKSAAQPEIDERRVLRIVGALRLNARAHYNLACPFCTHAQRLGTGPRLQEIRAEELGRALEELRMALAGLDHSMVEWAKHDPSLSGLRDDETWSSLFWNAIIEATTARSPISVPPMRELVNS
jgi:hypothetical protein